MHRGETVVCVNDSGSAKLLVHGRRYTVDRITGDGMVYLLGVPQLRPGFWPHRFRRAPRTDISIFTAMLQEQRQWQNA